ncbi:multidrug resistance-associated ABC transporter [Gloeophyllum trabeum ATCC 11539]|uniref:Multidrug resistance-associated ABC transporter n=1 Tax=Gloeophyllum trabeum (strain ATCC 11539 / FP-39264 / Madison 617) TaxID=670483 RepID=S7RPG6_GLOTA|nr:multidrug resistance-associated ABC transporter [Gloeophyllum trabeum ATCC 11539]EPQ56430.1 multidrug resistance-associated ABC transporter [Gloeophyllum trabeum ATCC 11539]
MAATCRDSQGWGPASPLRPFDFTPCFEEGILFSTLSLVLLVSSLLRCWSLRNLEPLPRTRRSRWILYAKLILLAGAVCTSAATAILVVASNTPVAVPQSYILEAIALIPTPFLTHGNHTRTRTSSAILLLFWPLYIALSLVWARSVLEVNLHGLLLVLILRAVTGALGTVAFLLECFGPGKDDGLDETLLNPIMRANIFSRWYFGWLTPLMKKGAAQFITERDLPPLLPRDQSTKLGEDLQKAMDKHSSLWVSLFVAYGGPYGLAALLKIVQDCLAFLQPQLLRWLLVYIASYQSIRTNDNPNHLSKVQGYAIALIMFAAALAQSVILQQYFQLCYETGMRVRAGLVTAIYKKALVLANDERSRSSGDIVNLMSVDATRMQDLCTYGLISISGPLQITLAFVSLYNLLGWSAFVGVAIMVVSIPLNTYIASILKRMQEQQMKNRDKRTRLMSELLANIRSIKLYAWEHAFVRKILFVRNEEELKMLRKIGVATALNTTLWGGIPLLVAFSSLATAAFVSSRPLTSDIIFPSISLFMLLQFPLAMFSQVTSNIIEAMVSVRRLSDFLRAGELQRDAVTVVASEAGEEVLRIANGEFAWSREAPNPVLEGIDLTVRKGELVGVLGRLGAGKSSLLSAIIGDMTRVEGEVVVHGNVSYAPQNPWIMSASIRDNILFSHEYEEGFYNLVLDACALRQDLALFPDGDLTVVGEKGITMSGGQRARVSLARAVYARADLILLDDVLAAVDAHVARHVFDQVIGPNGLLASKARILVTNSIAFLKHFDQIVFMRRGIILEKGTYASLAGNEDTEIGKLIRGHTSSLSASGTSTPFTRSSTPKNDASDDITLVAGSRTIAENEKLNGGDYGKATLVNRPVADMRPAEEPSKEHMERGRVKKDVYLQYIAAASKTGFALFVLASVAQQALSVAASLTLRAWGDHNQETGSNSGISVYLMYYGLFSLFSVAAGGAAAILMWVFCALRSARRLHDLMLHSVIRAPLTFFELTPTGRILNLFSRDTYVVDQVLGRVIQGLVRTITGCLSILAVIGFSFPAFLIVVPPLAYFHLSVMIYYLATSRELKRLDAASRSPIFAWFSESLNGLTTIRAFGQQSIFITTNEHRIDRNQICYLPSIAVNRWLAVRLEFVGAVIILASALLAVTALITSGVDAGLVGLVLSYSLNTTSSLNWAVRSASEVEQNIVSCERILHYTRLPSEAPEEIPDSTPEDWPSKGEIEYRNYSARYRPELDLVLRDISVTIKPKEKIGICGRTGSGKSSLLLSLFRIIEAASGSIYIDGIDISKIGLHQLRSSISIVPQSPDLFEGTMRENIDPTGAHQDADIWVALTQTHLREYVESLPDKLDSRVTEGGLSMSSGQRQLLCFARALLRKTKILVLDEATSAVDLDTDKAIQDIIRGPQFAEVTMLTIAHRLNTILESDRVLVLEAGQVVEWDSPSALLAKDSVFRSLATEAGLV